MGGHVGFRVCAWMLVRRGVEFWLVDFDRPSCAGDVFKICGECFDSFRLTDGDAELADVGFSELLDGVTEREEEGGGFTGIGEVSGVFFTKVFNFSEACETADGVVVHGREWFRGV